MAQNLQPIAQPTWHDIQADQIPGFGEIKTVSIKTSRHFEIENPRTKELPGMEWIKDVSTPQALDARDDRINLFVNLYYKKQTYYYAVRAVSPGTYKMGPVSADAMYNGEYHSYNGAGIIKVQ